MTVPGFGIVRRTLGKLTPMESTRVRLFAAARDAAGASELLIPGSTIGEILDELCDQNPQMAKVLTACSVLVDGTRTTDRSVPVQAGVTVDVLPPFAGG